jgi:hypothetical protein
MEEIGFSLCYSTFFAWLLGEVKQSLSAVRHRITGKLLFKDIPFTLMKIVEAVH